MPNHRLKSIIRSSSVCYFVDPSLATAALKIDPEGLIADLNTFGFVFETLCIRDLRTYVSPLNGAVYHFRDKRGREVDAVVVLPDGRMGFMLCLLGV